MNLSKTTLRSSELDDLMQQSFAEFKSSIAINAETDANNNLPAADSTDIRSFYQESHLKFQGLINEAYRHLQGNAGIDEVLEHKKVTDERIKEAQNEHMFVKEKGDSLIARLTEKHPPYNIGKMQFAYSIIFCLCLGDGIFNIGVFTATGSGYLEAVACGIFLAAVVALTAHFFKWMVTKGTTDLQKRLIALTVFSAMFCLFTFLALYRSSNIEQQHFDTTGTHMYFSPIPFIITSMLVFTVCVILSAKYCPTKDEQKAMREYRRLHSQREQNEAEQARLKAHIQNLKQEHLDLRQLHASVLDYGAAVEVLIMAKAHEGLEAYKRINVRYRRDNCRPPSFDHVDDYPFSFKTYFPHKTLNQ